MATFNFIRFCGKRANAGYGDFVSALQAMWHNADVAGQPAELVIVTIARMVEENPAMHKWLHSLGQHDRWLVTQQAISDLKLKLQVKLGDGVILFMQIAQAEYVTDEFTAKRMVAEPGIAAQLAQYTPAQIRAALHEGYAELTVSEWCDDEANKWRLVWQAAELITDRELVIS